MNFKQKTPRSKAYLDYIRSLSCCVCQYRPTEPHHASTGGTGMKGSDYDTIPMCRLHHAEYHQFGKVTFYHSHGIDLLALIQRLNRNYGKRKALDKTP